MSAKASLRWLSASLLLLLLAPLGLWLALQRGDQLLSGLRVQGRVLPNSPRTAARSLELWAYAWQDAPFEVHALGLPAIPSSFPRAELGATLPTASLLESAQQLGRSGNPLIDLGKWWAARRGQLELAWNPVVDAQQLTRFVETLQARIEQLPIAGITDASGFSLPGRNGRALDLNRAVAVLSRALSAGAQSVTLPVQTVAAPAPLALGSPDGAFFDDPADAHPAPPPPEENALTSALVPNGWLPAHDDDCFSDPPQRPFCDGPRRVPKPFGPAHELAQGLGLGGLDAVAYLIHHPPKSAWTRAAGQPSSPSTKHWPVPAGKLGRGFGYVRRAELRDRLHAGLDIVAPRGSAIHAVQPGIVAYADNHVRGYGNLLVIIHPSGDVTWNAHCQRIFVFPGQQVAQDQQVAEVGMTGLALGPHLHFEVRSAGQPIDPLPLFATVPTAPKIRGNK